MRRASLEELDVSWCRGIPEEALGRLVDACPALTSLTLFGCSQARLDLHKFVHACPSIYNAACTHRWSAARGSVQKCACSQSV